MYVGAELAAHVGKEKVQPVELCPCGRSSKPVIVGESEESLETQQDEVLGMIAEVATPGVRGSGSTDPAALRGIETLVSRLRPRV